MTPKELISAIQNGEYDKSLKAVYVTDREVEKQRPRYIEALSSFASLFGEDRDVSIMSAPGRTEICGNHTDHNNGKVLAASVNLDAIAVVSKNNESTVRVKSKGHKINIVDLNELEPKKEYYGNSTSLVRGVAAGVQSLGYEIEGFDAYTMSDVMGGSGLSSSAAFEVLIGTVFSHLFCGGKISPVDIAKIAQYSENEFFGKPCGLLDQMASSVGTFVTIDFKSTSDPEIKKIDFDLASSGYSLCIVDTGGNHSDLTDDYAAVKDEMQSVARAMGKNVLREVEYEDFFKAIPSLVRRVNDRAILRAIHFYNENKRVDRAVKALEKGDFEEFKSVIIESGRSSFMLNQNVYTPKNPTEQKLSLALALSGEMLRGRGAWRIHGGGFAGTVQAFVPSDMLKDYKNMTEAVFGKGSCHVLIVRPVGGCRVI